MLDDWPFGGFMCSFVPFTQSVSVFVSSFTMTAIAVDRYQVISTPLHIRAEFRDGYWKLTLIWSLSILLSIPRTSGLNYIPPLALGHRTEPHNARPHPLVASVVKFQRISIRWQQRCAPRQPPPFAIDPVTRLVLDTNLPTRHGRFRTHFWKLLCN